jgi:hypothetical protein
VVKARTDYQDELGWPALAAKVGRLVRGADVVVASNYGEAGALELFGRGLPPVTLDDLYHHATAAGITIPAKINAAC